MTALEMCAEAERLADLDEAGREREAIYIALRLGAQLEDATRESHELDLLALRAFARPLEALEVGAGG